MDSGVPVLIRAWLPDRPGALGLVASRIGALRGDIVGIDVMERGEGVAVDELAVLIPDRDLIDLLVHEIEQVDGASVEEVREVAEFPDPRLDALESARHVVESATVAELHTALVDHLRDEFLADWAALVTDDVSVVAGDPPPHAVLTGLANGAAASPQVVAGISGPEDLAVACLANHDATVLLGRSGHPLRRRERAQLAALARIADRSWTLLGG